LPYRLLPDIALADVAFEADSASLRGLFESSGRALTDIMVERRTLRPRTVRNVALSSPDRDRLLYDFLTELIILKDVDSLLFKTFRVELRGGTSLSASMEGEKIDRRRHRLRNDVKAVTMHMFGVGRTKGRWKATVVLDI
jgi:SHS2 domain-containing protein